MVSWLLESEAQIARLIDDFEALNLFSFNFWCPSARLISDEKLIDGGLWIAEDSGALES